MFIETSDYKLSQCRLYQDSLEADTHKKKMKSCFDISYLLLTLFSQNDFEHLNKFWKQDRLCCAGIKSVLHKHVSIIIVIIEIA